MTLYWDEEYREHDWDVEVCCPVEGPVKESGRLKVRELPEVETMACVIHQGAFNRFHEAYAALMRWLEANGYRVCGPGREVYIRPAEETASGEARQDDENAITEIQLPVEKM